MLDGNFIHMALKVKMDIKDRLKKVLLGEPFACFVPRAVLDELTALGPAFQPALQYAQACCEVLENPPAASGEEKMSAGTAIRALVDDDNKGKYMVATQDQDLKAELRHVPSVGLLFVSRAVLLMEPPSNTSKAVSAKQEDGKFRLLSEEERALLTSIKKAKKGESAAAVATAQAQPQHESAAAKKVRLKKKAKGPNPLSVKKSDKTKTKKKGAPDKKSMAPPKKQNKSPSGPSSAPPAGGGRGGEGGKKRKRKQKKKKAEGAAAAP